MYEIWIPVAVAVVAGVVGIAREIVKRRPVRHADTLPPVQPKPDETAKTFAVRVADSEHKLAGIVAKQGRELAAMRVQHMDDVAAIHARLQSKADRIATLEHNLAEANRTAERIERDQREHATKDEKHHERMVRGLATIEGVLKRDMEDSDRE